MNTFRTVNYISFAISINTGERQVDAITPSLFNAYIEAIFKKMEFKGIISINREQLKYLSLANDII